MFEAYVQESRAGREQKDREEMEALRNEVGRGGHWCGGYLHMAVVGRGESLVWRVLTHGGGG